MSISIQAKKVYRDFLIFHGILPLDRQKNILYFIWGKGEMYEMAAVWFRKSMAYGGIINNLVCCRV